MMIRKSNLAILIGLCVFGLCGCDAKIDRFPGNRLYVKVASLRESLDEPLDFTGVEVAVENLFGVPDEPRLPDSLASFLDLEQLRRAAGPVFSDQADIHFGLYREHCVTCHGIDGGGTGPAAALLNPYPRDFRHGVYKFKSTGRSDKPTKSDLLTVLRRGIPGTAMPTFARVSDEDLEALVQYTIYLSARGETERRTIDRLMAEEMSAEDLRTAAAEIADEVAMSWQAADEEVVEVAAVPSSQAVAPWWTDSALLASGKELFHGPSANCASCHGANGDGNATTLDFDDWTKEYTTKLGISPSDRAAVKEMRAVGALRPRQSLPRNLSWGVFHGDDSDEALYRRLVTGIAGTPMPGLLLKQSVDGVGVSPEEVWAIIAYIRSLNESSTMVAKQ
jgi:mono/diheme cytochrome c family protein